LVSSCTKNHSNANPITYGDTLTNLTIATNKAVYAPGETISFTVSTVPQNTYVRYWHLNDLVKEDALINSSWNWIAPPADFTGYLVELVAKKGSSEQGLVSIAVDVSSNWTHFPRYGFLSDFSLKSATSMDSVMNVLTRYHINGIQFYDWHEKHHQPLSGTVASPNNSWKDIANRDCNKSTIQYYIAKAHQQGIKAMFYNLCYGALSDAALDGVQSQWYMYHDAGHTQKDGIVLPNPPFKSDIFFLDPSNIAWQQYIAQKNSDVYAVYDFDGYHIDQVGNRDATLYSYDGKVIDLPNTFLPFINAMKTAHPAKRLVMNAVNQYGQQGSIASAPVDFLYSEVWSPNEGYADLANIIQNNLTYSNGKPSVLAAYMNYNKASNPGTFNTPGVLLAESVIFAFGGSHIEMGEHMLCKEYFPNNNLQMNDDLNKAITGYYDFLTAYENLLRGGGTFNNPSVICTDAKMTLAAWPPQATKVAVQGKMVGEKQVLHLINLANASSFDWRDTNGDKLYPQTITTATVEVTSSKALTKVWVASPDKNFGIPQNIAFTQNGNIVKFVLPELKYWDMIVLE
jgi:dextranase